MDTNRVEHALQAVGVDVIMSPERSRTLISFRDKSFTMGDPTIRPHLTIFEHSPGARVYEVGQHSASVPSLCAFSVLMQEHDMQLKARPCMQHLGFGTPLEIMLCNYNWLT